MGEAGGCWRKLYGGAVGGAVWVLWPSIVGKVVWGRCVEGAVHVGENWKAVGWGAGKLWRKLCGVELCDGKLCGGLWGNHGGGDCGRAVSQLYWAAVWGELCFIQVLRL